MADGYFLSEEDRVTLKAIIDEVRRRFGNLVGRGREGSIEYEEQMAPEVYIARTPAAGIPALVEPAGGAGPGTGTESGASWGEPGHADCDIFQIVVQSGAAELRSVPNLSKRVFNLSFTAMEGNTWVILSRDKFGRWCILNTPEELTCVELVTNVECVGGSLVVTTRYFGVATRGLDCVGTGTF